MYQSRSTGLWKRVQGLLTSPTIRCFFIERDIMWPCMTIGRALDVDQSGVGAYDAYLSFVSGALRTLLVIFVYGERRACGLGLAPSVRPGRY